MLKKYYPYEYVESVFSIDYKKLYDKGFRGIIFDIDNTLVPHGADSTDKVDKLFIEIRNLGFKTLLLSNNNEKRVKRFIKNIDTLYIFDAEKPDTLNYKEALKMLNLSKEKVIMIGDQIFTDILGANKSGIPSILVKFIGYYTETKIGIKRNLEKIILKIYKINKSNQNRIGDIEK